MNSWHNGPGPGLTCWRGRGVRRGGAVIPWGWRMHRWAQTIARVHTRASRRQGCRALWCKRVALLGGAPDSGGCATGVHPSPVLECTHRGPHRCSHFHIHPSLVLSTDVVEEPVPGGLDGGGHQVAQELCCKAPLPQASLVGKQDQRRARDCISVNPPHEARPHRL